MRLCLLNTTAAVVAGEPVEMPDQLLKTKLTCNYCMAFATSVEAGPFQREVGEVKKSQGRSSRFMMVNFQWGWL